jgi:hypothetical protein
VDFGLEIEKREVVGDPLLQFRVAQVAGKSWADYLVDHEMIRDYIRFLEGQGGQYSITWRQRGCH